MEKVSIDTIEIGNLLFGNSRGNFHIPRDTWQNPFVEFLDKNGFDSYGYKDYSQDDFFENDVFSIRPYYWGEDETIANLPNFVYKPTGFSISWYKYPMRDAYASDDISDEEFLAILNHCEESLKGKK